MTEENRTVLYFLGMLGICVLAAAIGVGIGYLSHYAALGIVLGCILAEAVFWGGLVLLSKLENRRRAR